MGSKVCKRCGELKKLEEFSPDSRRKGGRVACCRICKNADDIARTKAKQGEFPASKICSECNKRKLLTKFPKSPAGKYGRRSICTECQRVKSRAWETKQREANWAPPPIPMHQSHQECIKCGKCLPVSEFHAETRKVNGIASSCKECKSTANRIALAMKRPLPMLQTHKLCPACGECRPVELYYVRKGGKLYSTCNTCSRKRRRKYVRKNKEAVKEQKAIDYQKHKDTIGKKVAKWRSDLAKYETYANEMLPEDDIKCVGDLLAVVCKKCHKHFYPTNAQCSNRKLHINIPQFGEGSFYCSDKCKNTCDVYRARDKRRSETNNKAKARSCQDIPKKVLLSLQCDDVGYNYCELCGDIINVDLHHTQEVAKDIKNANNPGGMMLLCPGCHTELHASC